VTWWWKVKLLGQFFIDGSRPNHEFLLTFILNFLWDWFGSFLVVFPRNIEIQHVEFFLLLYLLWFSLNKQIIFRRKKLDFPSNSGRILKKERIFARKIFKINKLNFPSNRDIYFDFLIGKRRIFTRRLANSWIWIFTSK